MSALRVGICPEARPIKDRYGGGGGWLSAETLADIEAIVVMFEPEGEGERACTVDPVVR